MAELSSEVSELDARLAEIDRRLRAIQTELVPGGDRGATEQTDLIGSLASLTELGERMFDSILQLLSACEAAFTRLPQSNAGANVREFTVSAGPFASTRALRTFEQTLSGIPGVREVTVRAYEGEDRAIVDVRLGEPTS